jgi:hypothetical protein
MASPREIKGMIDIQLLEAIRSRAEKDCDKKDLWYIVIVSQKSLLTLQEERGADQDMEIGHCNGGCRGWSRRNSTLSGCDTGYKSHRRETYPEEDEGGNPKDEHPVWSASVATGPSASVRHLERRTY